MSRRDNLRIILIGPPGSGKGTQAKRLAERLEIPHISSGELFRYASSQGIDLGKEVDKYMKKGELVPDDLATRFVLERIRRRDCENGFILDGFPRGLTQAHELQTALAENRLSISHVLAIEVPDAQISARITGRRMDPMSGDIYHVKFNPPPKNLAQRLVHRVDDNEQTVIKRLAEYHKKTRPVITFYKDFGLLSQVSGIGTPEQVEKRLRQCLDKQKENAVSKKEKSKRSQHSTGDSGLSMKSSNGKGPILRTIKAKTYKKELAKLQIELVKLQEWIKQQGLKVVVIFEGRDAAGKGGVIKRITESLNPRVARVVALGTPTEREKTQWYFQRYVPHLPAAGEMVLFDRSWYNRAGVERVMGFCTEAQVQEFFRSVPEFERMLVRSGVILIKYWFSVSEQEQEVRFQDRMHDPTKRWKLSPMDLKSREMWVEYSRAKDDMFAHTDIKQAPWYVVDADIKKRARLNCIKHLLSQIPFEDLTPKPIKLPARSEDSSYVRPPITDQSFVPEIY